MSGSNCATTGCNTLKKHKLALFQIPIIYNEYNAVFNAELRENLVGVITREWVIDASL